MENIRIGSIYKTRDGFRAHAYVLRNDRGPDTHTNRHWYIAGTGDDLVALARKIFGHGVLRGLREGAWDVLTEGGSDVS